MIIVIGLGNIGQKYQHHRHNIGFQLLDGIAEQEKVDFTHDKQFYAYCVKVIPEVESHNVLFLAKPDTFMNNSGVSAQALHKRYPEAPIVVVYDDVAIPLGDIKCSIGKGSGGHNGIQSIIDHLGTTDFFRIRIGVRPVHEELLIRIAPPHGFEKFLLSDFAPFEQELYETGLKKAQAVLLDIQKSSNGSFDDARLMNQYNA